MSDTFGTLNFPVQSPTEYESVHDPALTMLGNYLQACLNAQLNKSWQVVNPGKKFVETVQENNPGDTFNERDLPALFVFRTAIQDDQVTDDWTEQTTDVQVTWVPQTAVQAKRVMRTTGVNGLAKVIARALELGRSPVWVDPSDTDPDALVRGSVLIERAKLFRWPFIVSVRPDTVTITKDRDIQYPAFTCIIRIHEITQWDDSFDSVLMQPRAPSKLDETVTSGNFSLESLIPTT